MSSVTYTLTGCTCASAGVVTKPVQDSYPYISDYWLGSRSAQSKNGLDCNFLKTSVGNVSSRPASLYFQNSNNVRQAAALSKHA